MILGKNIGSVYSGGAEVQRVFSHGKLVWERESIDYNITPFTIKAIDDTVSIKINNDEVANFKYSLNENDWIETDSTTQITINKHDKISIVGTGIHRCSITGLSDVFGNIMSLLYGDDFIGQTELPYILNSFFGKINLRGGSDIRHAKNLVLPATTLVNYSYMNMFYECEYLISAPKILPATTLTRLCYDCMFWGCRSLRTAPELPATTLADECYSGMFGSCENLTTPPELPATTLAYECYYEMFIHCDVLATAPELPATTLTTGCYKYMFADCPSLNYIKCYATGVEPDLEIKDCIEYWTYTNKKTGTLVCNRSYANKLKPYIPSTWTVEYLN